MSLQDTKPDTARMSGPLAGLARIEDGVIIRIAFFVMLATTLAVLAFDFRELMSTTPVSLPGVPQVPVLPAVDRPEVDPDSPAFTPSQHVESPDAVLRAPLSVELTSGGVLRLDGTIGPGASERVAEEIAARGEYVDTVVLNSPGGAVDEALALAQLIRDNGYATFVENGGLCASSCPLVLAGGTERRAGGGAAIGVHQIYASRLDGSAVADSRNAGQAMSDAQMMTARITRHFAAMGVDPAVWLHALETPPERLYYFTTGELSALQLVTEIVD